MDDASGPEAPFFIVYQMGKVGSSSIALGLRAKFGIERVAHFHRHRLALQAIKEQRELRRPVVIITGFREPLARCISAYFQNFDNPEHRLWYVGTPDEILAKDAAWLVSDYKAKAAIHVARKVSRWLSRYEHTVAITRSDFERGDGFWTAAAEGVKVYVYKLETIANFIRGASRERWLGGLQLETTNDGRQKWSGTLYQEFVEAFRITRAEYASLYGGLDYVRWLYDDHEIDQLTARFLAE